MYKPFCCKMKDPSNSYRIRNTNHYLIFHSDLIHQTLCLCWEWQYIVFKYRFLNEYFYKLINKKTYKLNESTIILCLIWANRYQEISSVSHLLMRISVFQIERHYGFVNILHGWLTKSIFDSCMNDIYSL
jgi:hypothetical protein